MHLELTGKEHRERWLAAVARSKDLHHPWVSPANTTWQFNQRLKRYRDGNNVSLLAIDESGELVACINLNEIVRGVVSVSCNDHEPVMQHTYSRCLF